MDKVEAIGKTREYVKLVRNVLAVDKVVLFGSYANGVPGYYSDIDVGLFIRKLTDDEDYLSLMSMLYKIADQIDVHIEPHVFIRDNDRSGFAHQIEQTGIEIG